MILWSDCCDDYIHIGMYATCIILLSLAPLPSSLLYLSLAHTQALRSHSPYLLAQPQIQSPSSAEGLPTYIQGFSEN